MAWIETTEGVHVDGRTPGNSVGSYTREQAEASAADRNKVAEELDLSVRYQAVEAVEG